MPIFDGQKEEVSFGQSDYVVEPAHARSAHVADEEFGGVENGLVHRISHRVLYAAVFVLKRRYGASIFIIVILIFGIDRYSFEGHFGLVRRYGTSAGKVDGLLSFEKFMPIDEIFHDFAFDDAQVHLRVLFLLEVFFVYELGRHDQYCVCVEQIAARLACVYAVWALVLIAARLDAIAGAHFLHYFRLKVIIAQIGARHAD